MKTSDFYFDLPKELIAQDPLEDRSASRLLVLDKDTGAIEHRVFKDIALMLEPGDCLVLNDTKGTVHAYDMAKDSAVLKRSMDRRVSFINELLFA